MSLTPRDRVMVEAILSTPSVRAAAKKAGVDEKTVRNCLARKDFNQALEDYANSALLHSVRLLKAHTGQAVMRLAEEMNADNPSQVRVNAAEKILSNATRLVDFVELRAKAEELEKQGALSPTVSQATPIPPQGQSD